MRDDIMVAGGTAMGPWGVFSNCHKGNAHKPILFPAESHRCSPASSHFRNHSAKKLRAPEQREGWERKLRRGSFSEMKATPSGLGKDIKDNAILFVDVIFIY